jgi:hypothetical protein
MDPTTVIAFAAGLGGLIAWALMPLRAIKRHLEPVSTPVLAEVIPLRPDAPRSPRRAA